METRLTDSLHQRFQQKLNDRKDGVNLACKVLAAPMANPLLAVARGKVGPKGEPVGSITTSPDEVDRSAGAGARAEGGADQYLECHQER